MPSPTRLLAEGDSQRHSFFIDASQSASPQDYVRRGGVPPSNMHAQYYAQHWHHEAAGRSHAHYPYPPYTYGGSAPPAPAHDPPPIHYGGVTPSTGYGLPTPGSWYGSPAAPYPGYVGAPQSANAPDPSSADGRHDPHVEWAQQHLRMVASPSGMASQAAVTPPHHQSGNEWAQEKNRQARDSGGAIAKDSAAAVGGQRALATLVEATSDQERTR